MKATLPFLTLCLIAQVSWSQNLVPNPSFEQNVDEYCGIMGPFDFEQLIVSWTNPTAGSPMAFFTNIEDSCYNHQPTTTYSGPIGIKGLQQPRTGQTIAGLWCYTIENLNQRQYITAELNEPMEVGTEYIVEFYVTLADFVEFSIDKLGAHLSQSSPSNLSDGVLNLEAHISSSDFITNYEEWVHIADTLTADQPYSFITIGNFADDASTNTQTNPNASGDVGTYGAYYFIDDVSITEYIPTGIEEPSDISWDCYPSPFQNSLWVESPEVAWIEIRSTTGQLVLRERVSSGLNAIDTSVLSSGMYVSTLLTSEGKSSLLITK